MTERKIPPSLDELGAKLRRAREREAETPRVSGPPRLTGLGVAFRVGVELVSALALGVGIGYLIDLWLGTKPWGLVVFLFLGAAAGILNVYRAMAAIEAASREEGRGGEGG